MKPLDFIPRRPADSYELQIVTKLRRKGRGWQDIASAIGRSVDVTKRLYCEDALPKVFVATPPPSASHPRFHPARIYTLPDRVHRIVKGVCERNRVTLEELKGPDKPHRIAHPRQELMALLMDAGKSSVWVGKFLNRDHATVLYGARVYKARVRRAKEAA